MSETALAPPQPIVLVAATLLSIPSRRIRALAMGDQNGLRHWMAGESATRLAEARRDARLVMERIEAAGARVVGCADEAYPRALLDLPDPPPLLVVRGSLGAPASGGDGVAIVGTREPSAAAERHAFALAALLCGPVVSGLALGIDAAAHRGALAAGTRTIAYVAHGLGETYPPAHADLEAEILAAGGAVASEVLPGTRVTKWALMRRDRLQAAHARAVVLVESEAGGGAMHTLRFARERGRPRFVAAPAAAGFSASRNALAIEDGAVLLDASPEAAARAIARALARDERHGDVLPLWKELP